MKFTKLTFSNGGYGSNTTEVTIDCAENCIDVKEYKFNDETINSASREITQFDRSKINKIAKIVSKWKDYYDQPGLCDGPEVSISIDDKSTYIHSVVSEYYPKYYKKVAEYFRSLVKFSGIRI